MTPSTTSVFLIYQGRFPSPNPSAAERRVIDLGNGLASCGHRVTIIAPRHYNSQTSLEKAGDAAVQYVGPPSTKPSLFTRLSFWSAVKRKINQDGPICSIFYNTTLDSLLAFQARHPIGYELCDLNSVSNHSLPRKAMFWVTERLLPRFSKLNIAISSGIESHLRQWAPNAPIVRIPGLADQKLFNSHRAGAQFRESRGIPPDLVIVGYSGTFFKQKGLGTLLQAYKIARNKLEAKSMLYVSGSGSNSVHEDNPAAIAAELGISDNVIFTGNLPNAEHIQYLSAIDVAVCPSEDCAFSNLSFPTKIAEYAAMAKAIVATKTGDIPHYFENRQSALLVPPSDPTSMSDAIVEVVNDNNLRTMLASAALDVAQRNFSSLSAGRTLSASLLQNLQAPHGASNKTL